MKNFFSQKWIRWIIVIISLLFIAGGAFNDGGTGWFWAGPFVWVLYFSLSGSWRVKVPITIVAFLLMVGISSKVHTSSIVYPVIKQEAVVSRDIPIFIDGSFYPDTEKYLDELKAEGKSVTEKYVLKGAVLKVSRIITCGELQISRCFVFSDSNGEVITVDAYRDILKVGGLISDGTPFCYYVDWQFCEGGTPVINKLFENLGGLMAYPFLIFIGVLWAVDYVTELF